MNLAELRAKLREARKECVKPVSKMRKGDIAAELERMGKMREETPHAAAVPSAKSRKAEPAVEHIRSAKEAEFPESSKPHRAEHHARTDEDVPYPSWFQFQDGGYRRYHPGRPAVWRIGLANRRKNSGWRA